MGSREAWWSIGSGGRIGKDLEEDDQDYWEGHPKLMAALV